MIFTFIYVFKKTDIKKNSGDKTTENNLNSEP